MPGQRPWSLCSLRRACPAQPREQHPLHLYIAAVPPEARCRDVLDKGRGNWSGAALPVLWLALIGLASPSLARAQGAARQPDLTDLSLEKLMEIEVDTVYGASKYVQKVTEAPASVSIVTAEEIKKYGYRTLADVLRSVRGFYVTSDRNYSYLGVRGFARPGDYNSRILLLVDGHRMNDNIFEQALIGTEFPVDVDLIERIEVIRGPNSSLYFANAFLGVVNVITRPAPTSGGPEFSGELASYGTWKGRVTYANRFPSRLETFLSATYYDSRGHSRLFFKEFDTPATNNGIAENADYDSSHQFFGRASYRDFTLHAAYGSREKGIPTASFDTVFNDPRTRTVDAQSYIDLQYDRKLARQWGLMGRVYYDEYNYEGIYVYDNSQTDAPSRVLNSDYAHGKWWGGEVDVAGTLF
ncbi:MAG: TonB-dependent receptor plug domain-containing protein, partial [Acidobacteriia bacterium]|nr:TonB-dependent receptor plug domain-containing protein [Terriglobia bacterium]